MGRTLGIGIIGAGGIFEAHVKAYQELSDRAKIVGVADVSPEKLRAATEKFFIPIVTANPEELIARDDVDIIDVCTPPFVHESIICQALRAGKYVMCEKPLAHTLESIDRIIQVAAQYPGKLSTIYQLRTAPEAAKAIWVRDHDLLGDPVYGRFTRLGRLGTERGNASWWGRWDVAGGGVVMTQFIHELDLICRIFGKPVEVKAQLDTLNSPIESEDTFVATIRFENGALVDCSSTMTAQATDTTFDIVGKKLTVHAPWKILCKDSDDHLRKAVREVNQAFPAPAPEPAAPPVSHSLPARVMRKFGLSKPAPARVPAPARRPRENHHGKHFSAVFDAIDAGQPLPIGPDEARVSLDLCIGIYSSGITGEPVALPLGPSNRFYRGVTAADYAQRCRSGIETPTPANA